MSARLTDDHRTHHFGRRRGLWLALGAVGASLAAALAVAVDNVREAAAFSH